MSVYELGIDGTSAEVGAKRIVKSFEDIKAAAKRMEESTGRSFTSMAEAFRKVSAGKAVSTATINSIREFSNVVSSFKGPSQATLGNTKNFFKFLESISGFKVSSGSGLRSFLEPLNNFKGPSASAGASVKTLLRAVGEFKGANAGNLGSFLKTFEGFKGPSQSSAKNVRTLLAAIAGFNAPRVGSLSSFLSTLAGYTGPTAASARNTRVLLNALTGFTGITRVPASFNNFLAALTAFRGPNASAGKNTLALLNAIATFRSPARMGTTITDFANLAAAIDRAANSMTRLRAQARGGVNVPNMGKVSSGFRGIGQSLGGLETALLRTQTAFNALGGILGVKFIAQASGKIVAIKAQLEAATGSVQQARVQFQFLTEQSNKMGLEFTTVAKSYGMLLGSIKGTNVTFDEAQKIFLGFSTAARALQLSTEDVDGVFRALGQIMSKGKLQAEELRGQLGDRLPGAFVRFAKALDMTKPGQLDDALKKGAISGDKLKKAILEVASTMEMEFAVSAEKASKTVDASFNRLKNTFSFAAADFGTNGFNAALISLADGLRKFLQSDVLNTALKGIAVVLKMLGDNIELVAALALGKGIAAFLRMAAAATGASSAALAFGKVIQTIKLVSLAAAAGNAARAFTILGIAMRANIFGIIATAVVGLITVMTLFKTTAQQTADVVAAQTQNTAELANIYDAYIAKSFDATGQLDKEIAKTRELTLERLQAAKAAIGEQQIRTTARRGLSGKVVDYFKNDVVSGDEAKLLGSISTKSGNVAALNTDQDALKRARALARINALRSVSPLSAPAEAQFKAAEAGFNVYRQEQRIKGNKTLDGMLGKEFGDYNKSIMPPGISGDAPETKKKEKGVQAFASDVDRAIRAFSELDERIKGMRGSVQGFLSSSSSAIAATAQAAAVDKISDLENAFEPKKRIAGILAVANAMGIETKSYDAARQALTAKYASQEEALARAQNDLSVAKTVADLRDENRARLENVQAVAMGGRILAASNLEMEVEKQLLGTSIENREKLRESLTRQLQSQLLLNQAQEVGAKVASARQEADVAERVGKAYGGGFLAEEIERYKELISYSSELKAQGYDAGTVSYLTSLKDAQQAQAQTLKAVQDEYEKTRQLAQDVADSLTDGLRDAFNNSTRDGINFLDRMKSLFKSLRDVVLNFVLFNPLREFLTDSLTRGLAGIQGSNNQDKFKEASDRLAEVVESGVDRVKDMVSTLSIPSLDTAGVNLNAAAAELSGAAQTLATGVSPTVGQVAVGGAAATPSEVGDASRAAVVALTSTAAFANVAKTTAQQVADDIPSASDSDPITVTASKKSAVAKQEKDYFAGLKKVFDYRTNKADLSAGFQDIKGAFSGSKSIGGKLDSLGKGIGTFAKVAGKAFAAYETGSGVAKALGLGKGGQKIAGGASAGFAVGGPIGAAVGAAAGAISAVLFKKTKFANTSITVGTSGRAEAGAVRTKGMDGAATLASGNAVAGVFTQAADQLGAYLTAGNYGTFGEAKIKGSDNNKFYSVTGKVDKKGRPVGTYGVDYINTDNEDALQAFALKSQIKSGKFAGLDPVYQTIAQNTTATTTADLNSDLSVGKSYLDFIDSAKKGVDLQKQVDALGKSYQSLSRTSQALGLDTNRLTRAYNQQMRTLRESFDFDIQQQILQFKDPLLGSFNALQKDYEDAVAGAMAVGGNINAVEELYGLKRLELIKNYNEQMTDSFRQAAKDMLTSLTASTSSPLSAQTTFTNAQKNYTDLVAEIKGGNLANAGNLQTYAQNYLDTAQGYNRSSVDYFKTFNDVTSFLGEISNGKYGSIAGGVTTAENLPQLPGVQAIVDKLQHQNDELLGVTKNVGAAIVETGGAQEDVLKQILLELQTANVNSSGGSSTAGYSGAGLVSRVENAAML